MFLKRIAEIADKITVENAVNHIYDASQGVQYYEDIGLFQLMPSCLFGLYCRLTRLYQR